MSKGGWPSGYGHSGWLAKFKSMCLIFLHALDLRKNIRTSILPRARILI